MEWERINPKTNIVNFLPRLFWRIVNKIQYRNVYFFDTNMFVKKEGERMDGRLQCVCGRGKIITSKVFEEEARKLLKTGKYKKVYDGDFSVINFEQIHAEKSDMCPVYYNFIHCMVNPANISTPLFFKELILSQKITNRTFSEEEIINNNKINAEISNYITKSKNNETNIFGEKKDDASEFIDRSLQKYYQKKNRSFNKDDQAYYNDLKSLSLALIFCMKTRVNVHFFTSDSDMVIHLRNWVDSVNHQLTLITLALKRLVQEDQGNVRIWSGKEQVKFKIPIEDYLELESSLRASTFAMDGKGSAYYFQIHSWDENKKRYIDDLKIRFDKSTENNLLNLHGPISCPFVKNNENANWFCWEYIWPPRPTQNQDIIELTIIPKVHRNFKTTNRSEEDHGKICSYAKADQENNLKVLSGFK